VRGGFGTSYDGIQAEVAISGNQPFSYTSRAAFTVWRRLDAIRITAQPGRRWVFAHMRGLNLREVRVILNTAGPSADRHAIYAMDVHDLFVAGFADRPCDPSLAAIGLHAMRRAFIPDSRVAAGATAFIGLHDPPASELVLGMNDLQLDPWRTAARTFTCRSDGVRSCQPWEPVGRRHLRSSISYSRADVLYLRKSGTKPHFKQGR
jgi:hypothetical protein